jgi:seryl-tRNA synthetase
MQHVAPLRIAIPEQLAGDFLAKMHYVSEGVTRFAFSSSDRDAVSFELQPGFDPELISQRIAETAEKISRSYQPGSEKTLVDRMDRRVPAIVDPHPRLEALGELFRYGSGRYALGPRLTRLVQFFDDSLQRMAQAFDAPAYQFPSLIGAEALHRCRYLSSFPHSLNLVSHLREDLGAIQHFARTVTWETDHLAVDSADLAPVRTLLAPSVCFHYYALLQDRQLSEPTTVTATGKCFRYESGNLEGLERLWDFSMREVIFVGNKSHVLVEREKSLELTRSLFDDWGLAYDIRSATDPFFIDDYASQSRFQLAFDLKFEARASLPYKRSTVAVGSFNYHQDFFGRSFNITGVDGQPCHTGCIGFGMERLVLAFLAQYGLDRRLWPPAVADAIPDW